MSDEGAFARAFKAEMEAAAHAFWREEIANFVLGEKGKYFDGDEWERRADMWSARCAAAEGQVAHALAHDKGLRAHEHC